jgi:hypothetical protein
MRKLAAKRAKTEPKEKARRSQEPDVNQLAQNLVRASTEEKRPAEVQSPTQSEISRVMAELGRRGGKIGGKMRLQTLTQERRSEIAFQAAKKRWANTKKP